MLRNKRVNVKIERVVILILHFRCQKLTNALSCSDLQMT